MPTPAKAISTYIHAKDGNRPYSMRLAFAKAATLEMIVKTEAIAFPPSAKGLDSITDILVRRFAREFENVYRGCAPGNDTPWVQGLRQRQYLKARCPVETS